MKLTIISKETHYDVQSRTVLVKLKCCPNLKWLESQFHCFDARVIRHILSKYVTVSKIITSNPDVKTINGVLTYSPAPSEIAFDYQDFFEAWGVAVCHADDEFNPEVGRRIAESRAKREALRIMNNILKDIWNSYARILYEVLDSMEHITFQQEYEKSHLNELIENTKK